MGTSLPERLLEFCCYPKALVITNTSRVRANHHQQVVPNQSQYQAGLGWAGTLPHPSPLQLRLQVYPGHSIRLAMPWPHILRNRNSWTQVAHYGRGGVVTVIPSLGGGRGKMRTRAYEIQLQRNKFLKNFLALCQFSLIQTQIEP